MYSLKDDYSELGHEKVLNDLLKILSEHPFGTIKWYQGFHYFLCRGFTKVTAEMSYATLAYNLRRAINILGTDKILKVIRTFLVYFYISVFQMKTY